MSDKASNIKASYVQMVGRAKRPESAHVVIDYGDAMVVTKLDNPPMVKVKITSVEVGQIEVPSDVASQGEDSIREWFDKNKSWDSVCMEVDSTSFEVID